MGLSKEKSQLLNEIEYLRYSRKIWNSKSEPIKGGLVYAVELFGKRLELSLISIDNDDIQDLEELVVKMIARRCDKYKEIRDKEIKLTQN